MLKQNKTTNRGTSAVSKPDAFFGEATSFNGTLVFDGLVRIDGNFSGNVKTNDTLIIAETGNVQAEVEAGIVKISGKFEGSIVAKQIVELHRPAKVKGDITTPNIMIDEGSTFNGQCVMPEPKGAELPTTKDAKPTTKEQE